MDKIFIIFEREYLSRVKKKSFILSTLLTPLIFPFFIAIAVFLLGSDDEDKRIISLLDGKNLIGDTLKIGNNIISRPFVKNEKMYLIKNNSFIRLN